MSLYHNDSDNRYVLMLLAVMLLKRSGRVSEMRIEYLLNGTERRTYIINNDYGMILTLDIFPSEGHMQTKMELQRPRGENLFGYMGDYSEYKI